LLAKASSDVDTVTVEVIAWDFGSQNESNTEFGWQPSTAELGR
jgi:hypothetical protein